MYACLSGGVGDDSRLTDVEDGTTVTPSHATALKLLLTTPGNFFSSNSVFANTFSQKLKTVPPLECKN